MTEIEELRAERDAYRKAKQENDERFQIEAADLRAEVDRLQREGRVVLAAKDRMAARWEAAEARLRKAEDADLRGWVRRLEGAAETYNIRELREVAEEIAALRDALLAEPAEVTPPAEQRATSPAFDIDVLPGGAS